MKTLKKSALAIAVMSCLSLSGHAADDTSTNKTSKFAYPETRVHQDDLDPFLFGEFGMSANTAATGNGIYDPSVHQPDDGVDSYIGGVDVDKYRWLENYDPINPAQAKEYTEDRQRNFIGTHAEDDRGLAAEAISSLQIVPPKSSSEVNDWVNAQNALTENYIENLPVYESFKKNAKSLQDREHTYSTITREGVGEFRYYRHEDGFKRVSLTREDGSVVELVNEKNLSIPERNVNAVMSSFKVSKGGSYISFVVRHGRSDADPYFIHVLDSKTGELATPIIGRINRSNPAYTWIDDTSLMYAAIEQYRSLVFRRDIGKKRFNDPIEVPLNHIDGASVNKISLYGDDKRYIVMNVYDSGDTVYIKDRKTGNAYRLHNQDFYNKVVRYNSSFNNNILAKFVHFEPKTGDVWFISGENNRKGEIIKSNIKNLKHREVVVPAIDGYDIMREAYYHEEGDGYFLISLLKDGVSRLLLVDAKTANIVKDLTPAEGAGIINNLSGNVVGEKKNPDDEIDYDDAESGENYVKFRFSNPTFPDTDYKYSIAKDQFLDIRRYDLTPFDHTKYETKTVFYHSTDGTKVPMNISYKKGIKLDGNNPTMLYGYGGYGVIYDQQFGFPANTEWLENGGVWAHAFIRGGGEYGDDWQNAAKHTNRLIGYDDFAAAADYLNEKGYADPNHIAIIGGSNGGLLVGAAMVRHPDKYRVAIPEVGVFDQFRHEKAGVTQYWMEEYGTPEEGRYTYNILKSYSPYHNLHKGICYPSTLIATSKRDDRVVPSHSYRFAAALQEAQSCDRPAFLHAAEDAGHSPNTYAERNERDLQTMVFALGEMGVTSVPVIEHRPSLDEMKTEKWRAEDAKKRERLTKKQAEKSTNTQ
ncbi:prolyl oligopeptidase family serine peptidase [Moraxella sp.]|uniref:prolyl oligopeptidase family serine peptidase n=1 Tax=Moraxella sp. TaxID=479 RepID=UPI0026DB7DB9|nr:prolyl oligopeptidase family serine peptidase [Moraxella sp.]MDO4894610.1 prolyl oligopeptidase family serine peptidase [Moraxella sp.]